MIVDDFLFRDIAIFRLWGASRRFQTDAAETLLYITTKYADEPPAPSLYYTMSSTAHF